MASSRHFSTRLLLGRSLGKALVRKSCANDRAPPRFKKLAPQGLEPREMLARMTWETSIGGNVHQYEYVAEVATFMEARALADSQGGHLVTIDSPAEQLFLENLLPSQTQYTRIWLGALGGPVVFPDDHWEWITGEPMAVQYWSSGEPNDFNFNGESAGELWFNFGGDNTTVWNDIAMGDPFDGWRNSYIIEYDGLRDRGLSDGPGGVNDSKLLASNLGKISTLSTFDASLRSYADIDWYQFTTAASGPVRIRVPNVPYRQNFKVTLDAPSFTLASETPRFLEYVFDATADQVYSLGIGSTRVSREITYQLVIAPAGESLPPDPLVLPPSSASNANIVAMADRLGAANEAKYYFLTTLNRAEISVNVTFDKTAGDLQVDVVNPQGEVLASATPSSTGALLFHIHAFDLTQPGRSFSVQPIYLRIVATTGPTSYVLDASARGTGVSDPSLYYNLGTVSVGDDLDITLQYPRRFKFRAASAGPLQIMVALPKFDYGSFSSVSVRDPNGAILATSNRFSGPTGDASFGDVYLLQFDAVKDVEYELLTAFRTQASNSPVNWRFLFLNPAEGFTESEPNNTAQSANTWGPLTHWVISADAHPSGEDESRTDVFQLIAGTTGRFFAGAGNNASSSSIMGVFVNGQSLPNRENFVYAGDVIRYEIQHVRDRVPYRVYGRIFPVQASDDIYERNETLGHPTLLPLGFADARYLPLLHDATDVDAFTFDAAPGAYEARIGSPDPSLYSMRIVNAATGAVVATSTQTEGGPLARLITMGGRFKLEVAAAGSKFSQQKYFPQLTTVVAAVPLPQSVFAAQMTYTSRTLMLGQFQVNYVGYVDIAFVTGDDQGADFNSAGITLMSERGEQDFRTVVDRDGLHRFAVAPGRYFLTIQTDAPKSIVASINFSRVPGDANGDGVVNFSDFAMLRNNFGGTVNPFSGGDLNGDRRVDFRDFALLRRNFGGES